MRCPQKTLELPKKKKQTELIATFVDSWSLKTFTLDLEFNSHIAQFIAD